jgi:hypothetical protein
MDPAEAYQNLAIPRIVTSREEVVDCLVARVPRKAPFKLLVQAPPSLHVGNPNFDHRQKLYQTHA